MGDPIPTHTLTLFEDMEALAAHEDTLPCLWRVLRAAIYHPTVFARAFGRFRAKHGGMSDG